MILPSEFWQKWRFPGRKARPTWFAPLEHRWTDGVGAVTLDAQGYIDVEFSPASSHNALKLLQTRSDALELPLRFGDKKRAYQMLGYNQCWNFKEVTLDIEEGADINHGKNLL